MLIDIPKKYHNISPELKAFVCNGAGAKDGIKVPSSMYGLNLIEAFNIHDFDYWMGVNDDDKRMADRRMLVNTVIMIVNKGGWLMAPRLYRAMTYFIAVAKFGKKAFYAEKERN